MDVLVYVCGWAVIMDAWMILNVAVFSLSLWVNLRRTKRGNPRVWLRVTAAFMSLYIASIYLLGAMGIIADIEIRLWMRWFQAAIGVYFIAEAING